MSAMLRAYALPRAADSLLDRDPRDQPGSDEAWSHSVTHHAFPGRFAANLHQLEMMRVSWGARIHLHRGSSGVGVGVSVSE